MTAMAAEQFCGEALRTGESRLGLYADSRALIDMMPPSLGKLRIWYSVLVLRTADIVAFISFLSGHVTLLVAFFGSGL